MGSEEETPAWFVVVLVVGGLCLVLVAVALFFLGLVQPSPTSGRHCGVLPRPQLASLLRHPVTRTWTPPDAPGRIWTR